MEEVVELANLAVLGEDKVGLEMQLVPTDDENSPAPENLSASSNQGESVYNVYWGHDGIFQRRLIVARNHNPCVHFAPNIEPTKMQLSQLIIFRYFKEGVLPHNTNARVEG